MIYKEEQRDLFSVPEDYYLAHCISADFAMGKGIAVSFNKHFNMKNKIQRTYPNYVNEWHKYRFIGDCILIDRVFNLITKERYWEKPTYDSIEVALIHCGMYCFGHKIQKIAMPVIGCGLDGLQWDKVSEIIQKVFRNSDIEILVCKYEPEQ